MKTVKLYEHGEEVLIKARIMEVSIQEGKIVYQVQSIDTGKNMGIWFEEDQLLPFENSTAPIIEEKS